MGSARKPRRSFETVYVVIQELDCFEKEKRPLLSQEAGARTCESRAQETLGGAAAMDVTGSAGLLATAGEMVAMGTFFERIKHRNNECWRKVIANSEKDVFSPQQGHGWLHYTIAA